MKLIDRYIEEVGINLPENMRVDIGKEIRSLIEDRLADRCEQTGGAEVDEAMVKEVLSEMGAPEVVASAYLPERYLIGPRFYPIFMRILKIVLLSVGIGLTIAFLVQIFTQEIVGRDALGLLLELIGGFVQGGIQAFGILVLVFALIEWTKNRKDAHLKYWSPQMLSQFAPKPISRSSKAGDVIGNAGALILFNFYSHLLGIVTLNNGEWVYIPILSENFYRYLPLMNIQWALIMLLSVYLLVNGKWSPWSEWVNIALKVFGMVIALLLISTGPLLEVASQGWAATGWSMEFITTIQNQVMPIANIQAKLIVAAVLVINGIEIIRWLLRRFRDSGIPVVEINP
jgi:hypothetical protein